MAQVANSTTIQSLTVQDAAAQLVELINSRATSPRQDEIEAIIARAAPSIGIADVAREIANVITTRDDIEQRYIHPEGIDPGAQTRAEREVDRLDAHKAALEKLMIELEPKDLNEVMSLVAIAADNLRLFADHQGEAAHASMDVDDVNTVVRAMDNVLRWLDSVGAKSPVSHVYAVLGDRLLPPQRPASESESG